MQNEELLSIPLSEYDIYLLMFSIEKYRPYREGDIELYNRLKSYIQGSIYLDYLNGLD